MSRKVSILLLLIIAITASAQRPGKIISYHVALTANYTGERTPDFSLPVGFGVSSSITFNKPAGFKPTIELAAIGFPEYVFHLTSNSSADDSDYAYGVFSLLGGSTIKIVKPFHLILLAGTSYNSREEMLLPALKPAIAFAFKNENVLLQAYYFKILNSKIMNGYLGLSVQCQLR